MVWWGYVLIIIGLVLPHKETFGDVSLKPPEFSHPSGFYQKPFHLTLKHENPDVEILYSLDGSIPQHDAVNGTRYRYLNQLPRLPWNQTGEFLEQETKSFKYGKPIRIEDRTSQPDRYSRIATTWHPEPFYFPKPQLGAREARINRVRSHANQAIDQFNRLIKNLLKRPLGQIHEPFSLRIPDALIPKLSLRQPEPLPVHKGTVVRAIAIDERGNKSEEITHTYFIMKRDEISLPIVAITISEEELFSHEKGILVAGKEFLAWREENPEAHAHPYFSRANWMTRGSDRIAHLQYYPTGVEGTVPAVSQTVGVRPHGAFSRASPLKSLRIYARGSYGSRHLEFPFFGDQEGTAFRRLILRNSGNDNFSTQMRDGVAHRILSGLRASTQLYQPAVVYINGEYYGILNIRERYDRHYLARVFSLDPDEIDLLENDGWISFGDNSEWLSFTTILENLDLDDGKNYEWVNSKIDIASFVDYHIGHVFFNNRDWPHNNTLFWRINKNDAERADSEFMDGRWRWLIVDLDMGFRGADSTTLEDSLRVSGTRGRENTEWSTLLMRKLVLNDEFQKVYISRFADLLNTHFLPERMKSVILDASQEIAPEIPRFIARWNVLESAEEWREGVRAMQEFVAQRPQLVRAHLKKTFSIAGEYRITLEVNDPDLGSIRVNSLVLGKEPTAAFAHALPWEGIYFFGVPVEIEAIPSDGACFEKWSGGIHGTNPRRTVVSEVDVFAEAIFSKCSN